MASHQKLFQLELNEINFDFVESYGERGLLPNLNRLIRKHGLIETTSEQRYDELEPWIQWVTAHTGLTFAEHGVFRLGDIVDHDLDQIWEWLERHGLTVGAVSPMNASNRTRNAAFFVPDPWTRTPVTGGSLLEELTAAISEAVNENATARFSGKSALALTKGTLLYGDPARWLRLLGLATKAATGQSWTKAQILEELLLAVTLRETKSKRPDYVSVFMNAGAHIQHHYMFNSGVYRGPHRNPSWLIAQHHDPILAVYQQYDDFVGKILDCLPQYRLIVATGLHQKPYPDECYYWRLKDHAQFLSMIGCTDFEVAPRMSRDFLVMAGSDANANAIAYRLGAAKADDGLPLFEIDNRGQDLFVMLTYPKDVPADLGFTVGNEHFAGLKGHTAFVAIKNGEHDGIGYLIDTAETAGPHRRQMELRELPHRIAMNFGLSWPDGHRVEAPQAA